MSHYGECRAMAAKSTKARCLQSWLSGNAVRQSLSHFPATCSKAIMVGETSRIFSGLAAESMSNILCRNYETGHLHFHPSLFQVARAASRFLTLTWFTFITIYGFNFNVECSSYTYDFFGSVLHTVVSSFLSSEGDLASFERKSSCQKSLNW